MLDITNSSPLCTTLKMRGREETEALDIRAGTKSEFSQSLLVLKLLCSVSTQGVQTLVWCSYDALMLLWVHPLGRELKIHS